MCDAAAESIPAGQLETQGCRTFFLDLVKLTHRDKLKELADSAGFSFHSVPMEGW